MRAITRSLKLIDAKLRENEEANELFLEILTSKNDPETVLRRMNEAGVLGRFVPAFGKIVAMMQFNMYHHYTVDEHLLRCIGVLAEIERGSSNETPLANELIHKILPEHRARALRHAVPARHRQGPAGRSFDRRRARGAAVLPALGFSAADTETVAWLIENHLVMSSVAQSRDLSDRKTIENFAATVQSAERLKLLTILTTADIRAVGPGVWNGWKAQLIRTLYYETEPVLTGGFSEVNRAQRVAIAQNEFREAMKDWPRERLEAYIAKLYPAYWLKVDLPHKIEHANFVRATEDADKRLATSICVRCRARRDGAHAACARSSLAAVDHRRRLRSWPAPTSSTRRSTPRPTAARSTPSRCRANSTATKTKNAARNRIADSIEKALRGELRLPDVVAKRAPPKGRIRAFALEPSVTINNQWSHRYTMVEVTGLDRTGLLYEMTATLSKLNLNIASAHVATFGERVVDVFYVTDLMGAQITSPTRQAAIKRALIALFASGEDDKQAKATAPRAARSA